MTWGKNSYLIVTYRTNLKFVKLFNYQNEFTIRNVTYVYVLHLMCMCCILCVCIVSYVYLLYLMCICCTLMCICCTYVCLLYSYVYLYSYFRCGLLARSQYPEGPATGHLDTGFSWFPCVYKRMLRWFPSLQVATTCFSCSPPDLNFLVTFFFFIFVYM